MNADTLTKEQAAACAAKAAADPWHNRAHGMRCSSCMWFIQKGQR